MENWYYIPVSILMVFLCLLPMAIALIVAIVCLSLFTLVSCATYKLSGWLLGECGSATKTRFALAMVFNVPVWILYAFIFLV